PAAEQSGGSGDEHGGRGGGPRSGAPATPAETPPPAITPPTREGLAALNELFDETGVPTALTPRTAARLGADAAGRLRADPWLLLRVPGVQPRQADHFARRLLGADARPDDPRRGRALVGHLLTEAAREGHTVTPAAAVVAALERIQVPDPRGAVEAALDEGDVLVLTEEPEFDENAFDEDAEPPEPEETLGLARWALAEDAAAEGFQRLTFTATPLLDDDAVRTLRSGLPEDRSLALTAAIRTGVSILRGAPGDVERAALDLAAAAAGHGIRTAVAAPTARAAADLAATLPPGLAADPAALTPRNDPPTGDDGSRLTGSAAPANGTVARESSGPRRGTAGTTPGSTGGSASKDAPASAEDDGSDPSGGAAEATPDSARGSASVDGPPVGSASAADQTGSAAGFDSSEGDDRSGGEGEARVRGPVVAALHRLLEPRQDASAAPGAVVFGRGEQRPLDVDLLFVTAASGLDVELCGVLVEACADGTHLVLCAEEGAPPPAGPGNPLGDLEASETVPVVTLDAEPPSDPLRALGAAVRGGDLVAVEAPGREVVVVPAADPAEAVHRAVQLVTDSIPRALGIPPEDVQVVAPATGGEAGATALNAAFKARLNPGPGRFAGMDPGDRVVVSAPLPQAPVGEVGVVLGGGPHGLDVEFADGMATLSPADAGRLRHGWAVTVAQAAGTPRPAVVAVMSGEGLSRPVTATAFGLARRHLSVVQAAGPALARAVREVGATERRTRLAKLVVQ
ncbi:helix-hairpin-helix domain-containing protein, partial [Actinomadura fibrosa]